MIENETMNEEIEVEQEDLNINTVNKEGSIGAFIGSIVIIIILLMGGWYIWQEAKNLKNISPINTEITIDEVAELDSLLENDFSDIDLELDQIDLEFE